MRLGVLFSGGKDSTLALAKAKEKNEVVCLITLISENKESYMFHTVNVGLTTLQAEALDLPIIQRVTEGRKEEELEDLKKAMQEAKTTFNIEGIVTGAIQSEYQAGRIRKICAELDLQCLNPLWKKDQKELLEEIVEEGYKAIISGVFAYPLDRSWLGKEIDREMIDRLVKLQEKYGISPAGEGGEIETTTLDAPPFRKRIEILESEIKTKGDSGVLVIKKARLIGK
ncbi:TIGR00289 family protein [Candidatus Bathyarchaeota archaeon]|nr:TIGR00289 family protein [Candidatus Bathyarchaeota archaeon]